jgi:tetratricopeptide (TPR) repeat protein
MQSHTENIFPAHKNYYTVMGLASSATATEISKTFKKLALKWHPDRHQQFQKSFAHKKFIDLMEAYEILGNPSRRSRYDIYQQNRYQPKQRFHAASANFTHGRTRPQADTHPKTDAMFEVSQRFEKELQKWRKKAGKHAANMAKKSYMQFAVSLDIVNKLVIQGIFHTIDLIAGRAQDKKTLNNYRKRLEQNPKDSITHYRMGFLYHQSGVHEEAAKYYLRSLKLNPNDADVFCNLGRLREDQGKDKRAISCYKRAVQLNPDLFIVYAYLGILHLKKQDFIEAKECLDYLINAGQLELANQIEGSY